MPSARVEHEWYTRLNTAPTEALINVLKMGAENSPLLIHGTWEDGKGGKCLAEWFGQPLGMTGPEFLRSVGAVPVSHVVNAWDRDPKFRDWVLRAIRRELFFRRGVRRGVANKTPGSGTRRRTRRDAVTC